MTFIRQKFLVTSKTSNLKNRYLYFIRSTRDEPQMTRMVQIGFLWRHMVFETGYANKVKIRRNFRQKQAKYTDSGRKFHTLAHVP